MILKSITTVLAAAAAIALVIPANACPSSWGRTLNCGSYSISGYHNAKNNVLNSGANSAEFAIGMLETDSYSSNYPYGDNKTQGGACFGFMKNNWWMFRTAVSQFRGQTDAQWNNGAAANRSAANAINYCNQCINYFGWTKFWEAQRAGQGGVQSGVWTQDINDYYTAVSWTGQQISNNNAWHNDIRYWAYVKPV